MLVIGRNADPYTNNTFIFYGYYSDMYINLKSDFLKKVYQEKHTEQYKKMNSTNLVSIYFKIK